MAEHASTDRRRLLAWAGASAAGLWLPRAVWAQARFGANPFALGVASGSPLHDSVVLWTRLVGSDARELGNDAIAVRWEVAHDEQFGRIVQSGQAQALPELAHSVHVEVAGLEPDRWYFYRFMAGDATSAVGRTRTFPAPDAQMAKLRLAYASCQRWEHGYFSAYRHMREENLDAVLFLGDYIYEYPGAVNAVRPTPGGWAIRLADYRYRYALYKSEPELQAMHASCPWIVTWDDHEVQNDYAGLHSGDGRQAPDFAARRTAAYQAYYEHMPVRASALTQAVRGLQAGAETRLYSRQRIGRLASLIVLDDRQYRDRHACTAGGKPGSSEVDPAGCALLDDPARTLLGAAQERWLDASFASAGPGWTILAQQTLFGQRNLAAPGQGRLFWNDGWDGYPAARQRVTESLARHHVSDTVLLGGDMHENWVGHIKADYDNPESATLGVEFCGTSITSRSDGNKRVPAWLAGNPHFVFADAQRKGYGVAEFTLKQMTATLRVVDDVTKRDTRIETLARFAVEAGRPRVERM
jgi:alkaline phosphatase D